jgi:hypothetical protein
MTKQLISTRNFEPTKLYDILKTLDLWSSKIIKKDNFSFIKFGDGEFFCMMGIEGENCDNHPYSKELGDKLYDAWYSFNKYSNIYIAEWAGHKPEMDLKSDSEKFQYELISKTELKVNFVNYEIVLQNTLSEQKYNFYKTIKNSNRKKIFVGPKRLFGVKEFLNIDILIEVPLINGFSEYENILSEIKNNIQDDAIYMFCSGMMSKSLIKNILDINNKSTCLDIGSGLDSIFVGQTREGQIPNNIVRDYYKELL